MSSEEKISSQFEKIQLKPDQQKKLADFLQRTDRFLDVRDFLERAIDVFLAWEQNPATSIEVMAKMNPTMAQYQVLSLMMQPEALAGMYNGIDWPKEWGSEWIEFQKNNPPPTNPDTDEAQKQMSKRKSKEDFKIIQENMTESKDFLNNIKFEEITDNNLDLAKYDNWPIISPVYSRFFPAKIAVITLADMMREEKSPLIDFEEFKIKAYDIAEEIADKLITYETDNKKKRSQKKSTGLPKPYNSDEITAAQSIKEERYRNKYFGKITKEEGTESCNLDGLVSTLGLVKVFTKDNVAKITLTENGKKFYLLNNPIFEGKVEKSISSEESYFISIKCISQRQLQFKINKEIVKIVSETEHGKSPDMAMSLDKSCLESIKEFLKENPDNQYKDKIQKEILEKSETMNENNKKIRKVYDNTDDLKEKAKLRKEMKQTPIEALRIAVMGRLTELGIIHWHINVRGRSEYTIENKELADSLISS